MMAPKEETKEQKKEKKDKKAPKELVLQYLVPEKPPAIYNHWKYGLEEMSGFVKRNMRKDLFAKLSVYYVVGALDNVQEKKGKTDKQKSVLLQGSSRLERTRYFVQRVQSLFNAKSHLLIEVPNVGYRCKDLFFSIQVRNLLFY